MTLPSAVPARGGRQPGGAARRADTEGQRARLPSRAFVWLCLAAPAVTYLLVVAGGVVRVSGSGLGCGDTGSDWPLCHGRLVPPADVATVIEFTHRCFAALSSILVAAVLVVAWYRYRHLQRVVVAASVAGVFFTVQVLLGAATVELKLPGPVVMVHLANAEFLLATLTYIAVAVVRLRRPVSPGARIPVPPAALTRTVRLAVVAAVATYVLVISGALVVANGAGYACAGWPLCGNGFSLDGGQLATVNLAHRIVAGTVVLLVGAVMGMLLRERRGERGLRMAAMAASLLLLLQVVAGALVVELRLPAWTRGVHLALGSALWAVVALAAMLARPPAPAEPQATDASRHAPAIAVAAPEAVLTS